VSLDSFCAMSTVDQLTVACKGIVIIIIIIIILIIIIIIVVGKPKGKSK